MRGMLARRAHRCNLDAGAIWDLTGHALADTLTPHQLPKGNTLKDETHTFILHINNDQEMQAMAIRIAEQGLQPGHHPRSIGEDIVEQFIELAEDDIDNGGTWGRMFLRDIGSTWRIDELAVGEDVVDTLRDMRRHEG